MEDIMQQNNHIPVFLVSSNKYAALLAVTAVSILDNTNSFIDFYIIDNGISDINKTKIKNSLNNYNNYSIEFIYVDEKCLKLFPLTSGAKHATRATYSRLLISKLKPELKKVIYTDIDVIFNDDIKKLYDEPLDNYILGAIPEASYLNNINHDNCRQRLDLDNSHKYFNAGVLLIDIEKWNANNIDNKIIEITRKYKEKLLYKDQDILNICFMNNYKMLSPIYNTTSDYLNNRTLFDKSIISGINNPVIIHFNGGIKPWNTYNKVENSSYFWKYAKETSFYEDFKNYFIPSNSPEGKTLKFVREILKIFPYFIVHGIIKSIDNKVVKD